MRLGLLLLDILVLLDGGGNLVLAGLDTGRGACLHLAADQRREGLGLVLYLLYDVMFLLDSGVTYDIRGNIMTYVSRRTS